MITLSELQALLDEPSSRSPEKIAVRTRDSQLSYAALHEQVSRVAGGLRKLGIASGDRVVWYLPNSLEALLITLACYRIGAVAVPLNVRYVAAEAQDVLQRTAARLLVFDADREATARTLLKVLPQLQVVKVGETTGEFPSFKELQEQDPVEATSVEPDHPALILFTSGSTGRPKGVVHSHRSAFYAVDVSRRVFEFQPHDVVLVGKPMCHAGGLQTQLLPTLQVGGEAVLAMKPPPPEAVSLIQAHSVTEYGLLASDLLDFVEYLENHPTDLPSLQNGIGSGDSVPVDLHHRFRDLLGWEIMEGAGMTEISGYYAANPRRGKRKWGSLGVPTPETELRIIDEQGTDCPTGETGEVVLRTPSATIGYWNDSQATEELFRDGWLHTGDLAYRDEDQYIWFVGRKKLMIIRRGSNIAPIEVENVIDEHPLVHASVVVGVRDARDGHVPVACVAALQHHHASLEQQLREYLAQRLSAYKNPVHYLFLDELPRTGTGKFDRHHLQELADQNFGN